MIIKVISSQVSSSTYWLLYRHDLTQAVVALWKIQHQDAFRTSQNWVYIWSTIRVHTRNSTWNQNSNTVQPHWPWHDCPTAVLSTTSLCPPPSPHCAFISARKYLVHVSEMFYFKVFPFWKNCSSLKQRKSGSVCASRMLSTHEDVIILTCRTACPDSSGC